MKTLLTHSGTFHADEVFAAATLSLSFASDIQFVRSRDEKLLESADFVVDVGGIYDEGNERFDHHQSSFKLKRPNGVPYASFGLVWKKYGLVLCGNEVVANEIDRELVEPIDAVDNGFDLCHVRPGKPHPFGIATIINIMNPTWKEGKEHGDEIFLKAVEFAKEIINRMIVRSRDKHEADKFVKEAYDNAEDKRIIVLENDYPAREILLQYPEPLFLVRPSPIDGTWKVETIQVEGKGFKNRKDFPKKWGGKRDKELQKLTFIRDAISCHRNLFIVVVGSKEGAISIAKKALE